MSNVLLCTLIDNMEPESFANASVYTTAKWDKFFLVDVNKKKLPITQEKIAQLDEMGFITEDSWASPYIKEKALNRLSEEDILPSFLETPATPVDIKEDEPGDFWGSVLFSWLITAMGGVFASLFGLFIFFFEVDSSLSLPGVLWKYTTSFFPLAFVLGLVLGAFIGFGPKKIIGLFFKK